MSRWYRLVVFVLERCYTCELVSECPLRLEHDFAANSGVKNPIRGALTKIRFRFLGEQPGNSDFAAVEMNRV